MASTRVITETELDRALTTIRAGQQIAGEVPTAEDHEAARRVLAGEATAAQVLDESFAELEAHFGHARQG